MTATILFLAQQTAPPQASMITTLMPIVFMMIIFYFLMIRPQQKRQKEHQQLLSSLKTGDKVVTSSGIHGLIANVKETTVMLKVADNVKIEVDKSAVTNVSRQVEAAAKPAA
ncbi:MAG: preprotein translocase subunit YajC [Verrucomicrobia bacterium]|nr:preprotein translocase subunit YajC [Verrucomicrobiota bacterium]